MKRKLLRNASDYEYFRLPQMNQEKSFSDMQRSYTASYAQSRIGPIPESEHQKPYENPDADYQELENSFPPWSDWGGPKPWTPPDWTPPDWAPPPSYPAGKVPHRKITPRIWQPRRFLPWPRKPGKIDKTPFPIMPGGGIRVGWEVFHVFTNDCACHNIVKGYRYFSTYPIIKGPWIVPGCTPFKVKRINSKTGIIYTKVPKGVSWEFNALLRSPSKQIRQVSWLAFHSCSDSVCYQDFIHIAIGGAVLVWDPKTNVSVVGPCLASDATYLDWIAGTLVWDGWSGSLELWSDDEADPKYPIGLSEGEEALFTSRIPGTGRYPETLSPFWQTDVNNTSIPTSSSSILPEAFGSGVMNDTVVETWVSGPPGTQDTTRRKVGNINVMGQGYQQGQSVYYKRGDEQFKSRVGMTWDMTDFQPNWPSTATGTATETHTLTFYGLSDDVLGTYSGGINWVSQNPGFVRFPADVTYTGLFDHSGAYGSAIMIADGRKSKSTVVYITYIHYTPVTDISVQLTEHPATFTDVSVTPTGPYVLLVESMCKSFQQTWRDSEYNNTDVRGPDNYGLSSAFKDLVAMAYGLAGNPPHMPITMALHIVTGTPDI